MARRLRLQRPRSGGGNAERQWLLRLIETMEQIARPEVRKQPCDRLAVAAVRAQLGRPPLALPVGATRSSLRN